MKILSLALLLLVGSSAFAGVKAQLFGIWAVSDIRCENNLPINPEARQRHWPSVQQKQYRFYDNSDGDYMTTYTSSNGQCDYLDYGNYRIMNSIMYLSSYKTTSRRCYGSTQRNIQSVQFQVQGNELWMYEEMGFNTNDLCYGKGRSILVFQLQSRNFYF